MGVMMLARNVITLFISESKCFREVVFESVKQPQKNLQLLIWPTENHVEGEQIALLEVAVSGEGVDGEGLEGVVEEEVYSHSDNSNSIGRKSFFLRLQILLHSLKHTKTKGRETSDN